MTATMNQESNFESGINCSICGGKGLYLKGNSAIFCSCFSGQKRKAAWEGYTERVKAEAEKFKKRKIRQGRRDFKSLAAGEREGREDEEVPF